MGFEIVEVLPLTGKLNVSYENKSDVKAEELSLRFNEQYIFSTD
jgi:hypothetical protein